MSYSNNEPTLTETIYLVVLRTQNEDYPLRLFADEKAGTEYGQQIGRVPNVEYWDIPEQQRSIVKTVELVTYVDGVPTASKQIKSFDPTRY